jgi:hypothetical protein
MYGRMGATVGMSIMLGLLIGCGPRTGSVSGKVTVDDAPLKKGIIVFADEKGGTVTANIVDGQYEIRSSVGRQRVQISEEIAGEKRKEHNGPNAAWVEVTKEGLPPRYNSKTELSFDVATGSQSKDWTLSRKSSK